MLNHLVIFLLLSSVGIQCLIAKPCARLYMNGVDASNYPQLAGVYILHATPPLEVTFSLVIRFISDCHEIKIHLVYLMMFI